MELVPYPPSDWVRTRNAWHTVFTKMAIDCVLDVGANTGQFGQQLRDIGYKGRIVSFEPIQSNFEQLEMVAGRSNDWRACKIALGSSDGQQDINVTENSVFSSFLTPLPESNTLFPQNRTERSESVQVRRLDGLFHECVEGLSNPKVYLKLDTQGFDLEVLKGATKILPQIAALQTEMSFQAIYRDMRSHVDSLAALAEYGFDVVDFIPVTRAEDGISVIEMDCVMVRRSGPLAPSH